MCSKCFGAFALIMAVRFRLGCIKLFKGSAKFVQWMELCFSSGNLWCSLGVVSKYAEPP